MSTTWNDIPFDNQASPEQKADEFDRQYAENQKSGSDKEYSGEYRPEPNGRAN